MRCSAGRLRILVGAHAAAEHGDDCPVTELPTVPEPGLTDSLMDVPGLSIGQVELGRGSTTPYGATGITAVVCPGGALGVVDVRGAAPGSRETDALSVLSSGEQVHAVLLVGRSVFGLAAADGATRELERRGIGLPIERDTLHLRVPIVAAAVIFDFLHGDAAIRPSPEDGAAAVAAAVDGPPIRPRSGNAGAGTGATTGGTVQPRLKGGVGHASLQLGLAAGTLIVGAAVVVNSSGSVVDAATGLPWAASGTFATPGPVPDFDPIVSSRAQTTLAIVGTNARLSKAQLSRVAAMAHDGLARAIRPVHTGVDGDAVFALSVAPAGDALLDVHAWPPAAASIVGSLAADAVTRAVLDAIRSARRSGGIPSLSEWTATEPTAAGASPG
jgi:L-aminopeptidase/D-esterase-like protein